MAKLNDTQIDVQRPLWDISKDVAGALMRSALLPSGARGQANLHFEEQEWKARTSVPEGGMSEDATRNTFTTLLTMFVVGDLANNMQINKSRLSVQITSQLDDKGGVGFAVAAEADTRG